MLNKRKSLTLSLVALALQPLLSPSAMAVPGVPNPPTVVWSENFQNLPTPTTAMDGTSLTSYSGLVPAGQTYTADPNWLMTGNMCNGIVAAYNLDPNGTNAIAACSSDAQSWNRVQQLSQALGILRGQDAATTARDNYAIASYTSGNPGAGIVFRTATNIPISVDNRFLIAEVDTAVVNCAVALAPRLTFAFADQTSTETALPGGEINACNGAVEQSLDARGVAAAISARIATRRSGALLFTGTSIGYVMRNAEGSGGGNDYAYDNPAILDATPQLDKSFVTTSVELGGTSTILFTITNTTELAAKNGWSFTDNLASGLRVAATPPVTTSCGSATIVATAGSSSISVSGNLDAGMTSCTVSVPVEAVACGIFSNTQTNITAQGVLPPEPGTTNQISVAGAACSKAVPVVPPFLAALLGLCVAAVGALTVRASKRK